MFARQITVRRKRDHVSGCLGSLDGGGQKPPPHLHRLDLFGPPAGALIDTKRAAACRALRWFRIASATPLERQLRPTPRRTSACCRESSNPTNRPPYCQCRLNRVRNVTIGPAMRGEGNTRPTPPVAADARAARRALAHASAGGEVRDFLSRAPADATRPHRDRDATTRVLPPQHAGKAPQSGTV